MSDFDFDFTGTFGPKAIKGSLRDGQLTGDLAVTSMIDALVDQKAHVGMGPWSGPATLTEDPVMARITIAAAMDETRFSSWPSEDALAEDSFGLLHPRGAGGQFRQTVSRLGFSLQSGPAAERDGDGRAPAAPAPAAAKPAPVPERKADTPEAAKLLKLRDAAKAKMDAASTAADRTEAYGVWRALNKKLRAERGRG